MNNIKINILVPQYRNSYVPNLKTLRPVTCGIYKSEGKLSDSTGINISHLRDKYCELTIQYWAWKNMDSDYYGFFNSEKYISFNENSKLETYKYNCMDQNFINDTCLNDFSINEITQKYDIIVPNQIKIDKNLWEYYGSLEFHKLEDLNKIFDILLKKFPKYKKSIDLIKKSKVYYPDNIYIMKKQFFFEYCNWLFPLLEEFDLNHNYKNHSIYSIKIVKFLAEILFNIYIQHLTLENKKIKIKILPSCIIKNVTQPYPIKTKNSIPVTLACDNKYSKYAGLIIEEIMMNNTSNSFYEIFIMSNGISKFWNEKLIKMNDKYKNLKITIVDGERWLLNKELNEIDHVNKTTFLRLCILDYLKNYDKVIYLDCDTTINDDLNNLYKIDIENFAIGACLDTVQISYLHNEKSNASILFKKYGIKNPWNYFNAGVLLMNIKKMNEISSWDNLLTLCEKNKYRFQDQDVLNIVYQEHVKILDSKWNCFSHNSLTHIEIPEKKAPINVYLNYIEACKNPSIIHYAARTIPSLCGTSSLSSYFWKFAKESEFYFEILRDMVNITLPSSSIIKNKKSNKIKKKIIAFVKKNKFLYKISLIIYRKIFK